MFLIADNFLVTVSYEIVLSFLRFLPMMKNYDVSSRKLLETNLPDD